MSGTHSYSLWIVPSGNAYIKLKTLIGQLSIKHDSFPFIPHISVVSNITDPVDTIEEKLGKTSTEMLIKPFPIALGKLTYFDEKPGGLYYLVSNNPALLRLMSLFKERVGYRKRPYAIPPHLTITYGKLDLSEKKFTIAKLKDIPAIEFETDTVCLANTSDENGKWRIVKKFPLKQK